MSFAALINVIFTLLPEVLATAGVNESPILKLIEEMGKELPNQIVAISKGEGFTATMAGIMGSLRMQLEKVQANLDPEAESNTLSITESLVAALSDAIASYEDAAKKTDPSTLKPLPEKL